MKKIGLFILGLSILFFAGNFTQAKEYEYTNLDITADILIDGTMKVQENFTANFFTEKHGIIRAIPLNYSVGGKNFHINISKINVKGKKFKTTGTEKEQEIKIGNANKTLKGIQEYPISYKVYGLIRNFSGMGYAELYWNLVGYDFDTNINHVKAEIHLPKVYTGFTSDDFQITTDGTTKTVEEFQGTIDWTGGDKITIIYDHGLPAYHGITLAIKFPNDYFEFNHNKQESLIGQYKKGNSFFNFTFIGNALKKMKGIFLIILIVIMIILSIFPPLLFRLIGGLCYLFKFIFNLINQGIKKIKSYITRKRGGLLRGKLAKQFPVIVQYNPPKDINSAEASLLLHRHAESVALVSLIYKWAIEGLISIKSEFKKDRDGNDKKKIDGVIIEKLGEIDESVPNYEKNFFKCFQPSQTISNNKDITINLQNLKSLEAYGKQKKWFSSKKTKKSLNSWVTFLVYLSCAIFICTFALSNSQSKITIFLVLFGVMIICAYISNKKSNRTQLTESGAEILSQVLGYREFLQKCEENQIRTFLKEDPLFVNKALPYATIFGIESDLIKKILPIMNELNIKIDWYKGDLTNMNNFVSSIHDYTPSTPSEKIESDFFKSGKGIFDSGRSYYSSSSGHSSGSSFGGGGGGGGGFSSGGGGGGGGGRSW